MTDREKIIGNEIQKNRNRLLAFIQKRLPASEDAEDVLQDVFYRFVIGYDEIKSIDKITSWLYTAARNKITDLLRKKKREPVVSMETSVKKEGEDELTIETIIPSGIDLPDKAYSRSLVMEKLEEALEELPEEQQEAFIQNELDEKSFREISEQTGVPVNTLLSRKRRAVLYLRERLKSLINEI